MPRRSRHHSKSHSRRRLRRLHSPGSRSLRKRPQSRERCRKLVNDKIRITMREFHKGRWKSRSQAIAVAFSSIRRQHPWCSRYTLQKRKR